MRPMLAQPATAVDLIRLANDPLYYFQQKLDGQRIMVVSNDNKISLLNREGQPSTRELPLRMLGDLRLLPSGQWVLDCELVNDTLWVFDLPASEVYEDDRYPNFAVRDYTLETLFKVWKPKHRIIKLRSAIDTVSKHMLA